MYVCSSLLILIMSSCNKESASVDPVKPSPYYVRMTDAPASYNAIYIDIQAIEIKGSNGTVTLNTNAGVYNLLNFSNGVDTLLAMGNLYVNRVEQIRLILGNNNSIVTSDGVSHPLSTPSAQQSGLKLQVHQNLQPGVAYIVLLDFDASQSIVEEGNGGYSLKPVIRTIETAISGSIGGHISVPGVIAVASASNGTSTYSSVTNTNGDFLIGGLPPDTYTVTVSPPAPYNTTTINNVVVTAGVSANVGVVPI